MTTSLPPSSDFTGAAVTEGGVKSAMTALRDFLSGLFGTDGAIATALATLGAAFSASAAKTTTYAVVAADKGKVINCTTGTWSLTLLPAASAGDGFTVAVRNSGSGVITIDPYLTETINGAGTLALAADESAVLVSNGSAWLTFGYAATIDLTPYKKKTDVTAGTQYGGGLTGTGAGTTTGYVKVVSARCLVSGTVRVWSRIRSSDSGTTAYGKVYVNGAAVGAEHSTTSLSFVDYTDDITVTAGDIIQLYGKTSNVAYAASINGIAVGVADIGACGDTVTPARVTGAGLE